MLGVIQTSRLFPGNALGPKVPDGSPLCLSLSLSLSLSLTPFPLCLFSKKERDNHLVQVVVRVIAAFLTHKYTADIKDSKRENKGIILATHSPRVKLTQTEKRKKKEGKNFWGKIIFNYIRRQWVFHEQ